MADLKTPALWKNWYAVSAAVVLVLLAVVFAMKDGKRDASPEAAPAAQEQAAPAPDAAAPAAPANGASQPSGATAPKAGDREAAALRDATRLAQLNDLAAALRDFGNRYAGTYPQGVALPLSGKTLCTTGWMETCITGQPVFKPGIAGMTPPAPAYGTACNSAKGYVYTASSWRSWYELRFCLEVGHNGMAAGMHSLTPNGYDRAMDPTADADQDGLSDVREAALHTNPRNRDTDSDGFFDWAEVSEGKDPLVNAQSGQKVIEK